MQELKVVGAEAGALIAVSEAGDRFVIAIDAVMQTKLRQLQSMRQSEGKISPREIQSLIRSGLSREEVAAATGASIDDIERFEGPVLAEREHILASALAAPVYVAGDETGQASFGSVIASRLEGLAAGQPRWASWKNPEAGWVIKLEFTANGVEHDARWQFDPKALSLSPLGPDATKLSAHAEPREGLIPRLRALGDEPVATRRADRFDTGTFAPLAEPAVSLNSGEIVLEPPIPAESTPLAAEAAINRAEEAVVPDTEDLLEALRRRRGEHEALSRDTAPRQGESEPNPAARRGGIEASETSARPKLTALRAEPSEQRPPHEMIAQPEPERHGVGNFDPFASTDDFSDELLDDLDDGPISGRHDDFAPEEYPASADEQSFDEFTAPIDISAGHGGGTPDTEVSDTGALNTAEIRRRKGRASLPSWDDIMFGARTDDA